MNITPFNFLSLTLLGLLLITSCSENSEHKEVEIEELNFIGLTRRCAGFSVIQFLDEDETTLLRIDTPGRDALNLTSDFKEFDIPNNDIKIEFSKWDGRILKTYNDLPSDLFCDNSPLLEANKILSFNAISGKIKIKAAEDHVEGLLYSTTIELENIILKNDEGKQKRISNLIISETVSHL